MTKKLGLFLSIAILCGAAQVHAASESEAALLATALKAEEELTQVIQKASAAFAFIGGGSGVVVSADGYILTNHHVAGDRKQWTVRIEGTGKLVVCDLVGTDPIGDLCLLKARDVSNLAYVEFGDITTVRVGQQVLAVGDPFKLADLDGPPSVSIGTISALHRFQGNYSDAIQTDSAVNPGNSGGPLLTLDGKLIGITGQIMSRFGAKANTGIGYAIPVDQILRFYPLLKEAKGKVVYHGTLPDGLTFSSRVDDTQAALIDSVEGDSPAARLGFKANDKIVSVDGKRIYNHARLLGIIRSYPADAPLDIEVERDGKVVQIPVKLPRMEVPPQPVNVSAVGVRIEPLKTGDGMRVLNVERGSPAEKCGITVGDVVLSVDGRKPSIEWHEVLLSKKPGEPIDIQIRRASPTGNVVKTLSLTLEEKRRKP